MNLKLAEKSIYVLQKDKIYITKIIPFSIKDGISKYSKFPCDAAAPGAAKHAADADAALFRT